MWHVAQDELLSGIAFCLAWESFEIFEQFTRGGAAVLLGSTLQLSRPNEGASPTPSIARRTKTLSDVLSGTLLKVARTLLVFVMSPEYKAKMTTGARVLAGERRQ